MRYIVKKCPALHTFLGQKNRCQKSLGGLTIEIEEEKE